MRASAPRPQIGALAIVRWGRRQVGDERIELAIRAGGERRPEPLVELLSQQPPLGRGLVQPLGHLFPIGV
jgi:hypothetical protein